MNNIDQICDELTLRIETLRQFLKSNPQSNSIFGSEVVETGREKKRKSLERTVRDTVIELEKTKKHFKSKTIKEVKEKLIKALNESR